MNPTDRPTDRRRAVRVRGGPWGIYVKQSYIKLLRAQPPAVVAASTVVPALSVNNVCVLVLLHTTLSAQRDCYVFVPSEAPPPPSVHRLARILLDNWFNIHFIHSENFLRRLSRDREISFVI